MNHFPPKVWYICFANQSTMDKSTNNFAGQPILGQLLSFIPKNIFNSCVSAHQSEAAHKTVTTWDQFTFMFYGVLTGSSTLREIAKNFALFGTNLAHCGIDTIPARSSVSDANRDRDAAVFGALYTKLYLHYKQHFSDSPYLYKDINGEIDPKNVEIFDSSTVSLFCDVYKNTGRIPENGQKKGGIKAFTKINLGERVPNFVCLKAAVTNEKLFLSELQLPSGTIVVFDKGFQKFSQYQQWSESNIGFVTRMNENATFEILESFQLEQVSENGIIKDAKIALSYYCPKTKQQLTTIVRMVVYIDPETGNELAFLTNIFKIKAITVCMLYKNRWVIEPLFKQLKQNFELTYFLSHSEQGIKTQIWIALILNLLLTVWHKITKETEDFATLVKVAAKNCGSYVNYLKFILNPTMFIKVVKEDIRKIQLELFNKTKGGGFANST
jgi:hypothetical protein